eukprot:1649516-Prymnesium_polylepis.1
MQRPFFPLFVVVLARTVGVERFFGVLDTSVEEAARAVGVGGELLVPLDIAVAPGRVVDSPWVPPGRTKKQRGVG